MRSRNPDADWTGGITIALLSGLLTPKQAARVKYQVALFDSMDPEGAEYARRVAENDSGHQWFKFCLDAVARREN